MLTSILPPYMTVPVWLKTTRHWSKAGTVCNKWKVRKSHWRECYGKINRMVYLLWQWLSCALLLTVEENACGNKAMIQRKDSTNATNIKSFALRSQILFSPNDSSGCKSKSSTFALPPSLMLFSPLRLTFNHNWVRQKIPSNMRICDICNKSDKKLAYVSSVCITCSNHRTRVPCFPKWCSISVPKTDINGFL